MPRRLAAWLAAALALTLAASPAAAHTVFPSRIDLPTGFQPEGIADRGLTAFVGSLATGQILTVNLRTGTHAQLVAGGTPPAVGLDYERRHDRLWVAGGPSGQVRVYDASSGALLRTYTVTAGFLNDVAVTRNAVYVTDSFIQQLVVIPLGSDGSLPTGATIRPIQAPFTYVAGQFNANGIVGYHGSLLIPNSHTGQLFAVDPATGASHELLPAGSVPFADGLERRGSTLYVVQNQLNRVARYRIRGDRLVLRGTITSADLSVPTTATVAGGRLWAVNARFGVPNPTGSYWITRLPAR